MNNDEYNIECLDEMIETLRHILVNIDTTNKYSSAIVSNIIHTIDNIEWLKIYLETD